MKKETYTVIQKALPLFLLFFVVLGSILGSAAVIVYRTAKNDYINDLKTRESRSVDLENSAVLAELDAVENDVRFLAGQNELIRFLDSGDARLLPEIQNEYLHMANIKLAYDQIRFLDSSGMEVIRVNNAREKARPVPAGELQNKGQRYYFTEAYAFEKDSIYASPLDLNVEKGVVEDTVKPMIRIGTPLFDSRGTRRGVLLINYTAARMLDQLLATGKNSPGETMLLNQDGYWLLGPDPDRVWGFMFKDRSDETFDRDYPQEWLDILSMGDGQLMTGNGLFTFVTLRPLQTGQHSDRKPGAGHRAGPGTIAAGQHFWVLLSVVPPGVMQAHAKDLLFKLLLGGGALFLFMLGGGGHLSIAITRRREYQAQLVEWALYDTLTGLANRKLFFDHLSSGVSLAKRHERRLALLYIDLDGFKAVNDTHGHEAGDDLLIQVGNRLTGVVRKSDTVARLGGDEFAVILAEIGDRQAAFQVGEKIVEELSRPFTLKRVTVTIGASIGVAVYPDHADEEKALVQGADRAMYVSKAKGKNRCTSAGALED